MSHGLRSLSALLNRVAGDQVGQDVLFLLAGLGGIDLETAPEGFRDPGRVESQQALVDKSHL